MITIRSFTPDDYEAAIVVGNACYPDHTTTVEEMRFGDEHRDPRCRWGRFLGETENGKVVATADYGQWSSGYHPQKFFVEVGVLPDYRRRGYGAAMYDHLREQLAVLDPIALRTFFREDAPASMAFATQRGFVEEMRVWESHLDVPSFDFAPFADASERVTAEGIVIKTEKELESEPDRIQKLYDLLSVLGADVPSPEPYTPQPYDVWMSRFESPNYDGALRFVALDGNKYVGYSGLSRNKSTDHLHTGLTGVRREYRRRGIALALKLRAVACARELGAPIIRTGNESNNRGMLSINERLGFVKQPAWLDFLCKLKDENAAA